MVVGAASERVRRAAQGHSRVPIQWAGSVPRERIPEIDRSAHLLFSADIHPACPNAVIEALACGLPVVGFDTGALSEIVDEGAGRIVPYGSDAWNLEKPDFDGLAAAAQTVLNDLDAFQRGARRRAEQQFGLQKMVDGYLEAIGW
jgi:glycosyltransferase involved in cell wall biosynthesis